MNSTQSRDRGLVMTQSGDNTEMHRLGLNLGSQLHLIYFGAWAAAAAVLQKWTCRDCRLVPAIMQTAMQTQRLPLLCNQRLGKPHLCQSSALQGSYAPQQAPM